jgi:citronellol/citronellal dehydrogenase
MKPRRRGAIVNVSSLAALLPIPDQMSYGMAKIALERFTVDAARVLQEWGIAVNCFRIDIPVASEGFVANTPMIEDRSNWEPPGVAAEGIMWMLQQPVTYSGNLESMYHLREREHIMTSQAPGGPVVKPTAERMASGLWPPGESAFRR